MMNVGRPLEIYLLFKITLVYILHVGFKHYSDREFCEGCVCSQLLYHPKSSKFFTSTRSIPVKPDVSTYIHVIASHV